MDQAWNGPLQRPLKMGLIGGGGTGFIGKVHALAATLDGRAQLVAGAFSSDAERSRSAAPQFGVSSERAYGSVQELLTAEQQRPSGDRIDFVGIATPNATHFPFAMAALDAGFHVVCDKPMTIDRAEAEQLCRRIDETGLVFALTHNYSGYPMVREIRERVLDGQIGELLAVRCNYFQGWLHTLAPEETPARGAWKSDPAISGPAGSLGDIGTHAFHLIRFTTDWTPRRLACLMRSFHPSRPLDDYGQVTLETPESTLGSLVFSQMSHGRLNDLVLDIDGTSGSLTWAQESPNQFWLRRQGQSSQFIERSPGDLHLSHSARHASRIPPGHPEGFLEAFANVYRSAFDSIVSYITGEPPSAPPLFPTVRDGLEGVRFIEACLASSQQNGNWVSW